MIQYGKAFGPSGYGQLSPFNFVPVALGFPIVLLIVLRGVGPLVRTSSKA